MQHRKSWTLPLDCGRALFNAKVQRGSCSSSRGFRTLLLWSLVQAVSLGFWHLVTLGLWPCSPHGLECSWDPSGRGRTHQGLIPHMVGSLLLEAGSHIGMHASLGSSLWDTMTQCNMEHGSWTATRKLRTTHPRSWRRELLQEDGDSETQEYTFQTGWRSV